MSARYPTCESCGCASWSGSLLCGPCAIARRPRDEAPEALNKPEDRVAQSVAASAFNSIGTERYERARDLLLLCHAGETAAVAQALVTEPVDVLGLALHMLAANAREERDRVMRRYAKEDHRC